MTPDAAAAEEKRLGITRGFLVVTIAGAITGWEIGFEYGAFDTLSHR